MHRQSLHWSLLALLAVGGAVAPGRAAEPAAWFPADALFYAGWSPGTSETQYQSVKALTDAYLANPSAFGLSEAQVEWLGPGIRFFLEIIRVPGGLGILEFEVIGDGEMGKALYVVTAETGPRSAKTSDQFRTFMTNLSDVPVEQVTIEGYHLNEVRPEAEPETVLRWTVLDGRFYYFLGRGDVAAQTAAFLRGPTESLIDDPTYAKCNRKVGYEATPRFSVYVAMERVVAAMTAAPRVQVRTRPVIEALGLDTVQGKLLRIAAPEDGPWQTRIFAATEGPPVGLTKLFAQAPLRDADFALIPRDAYWAVAKNVDLATLHDDVMLMAMDAAPDAHAVMSAAQTMAQGVLGFSLRYDLFEALGDTWILYDAPEQGGFLFSHFVGVVDVADENTLREVARRLLELARTMNQDELLEIGAYVTTAGDTKIYYVAFEGRPVPIAPAAAFVDGRLVFGLTPQAVATALPRVKGQRSDSILERASVRTALRQMPAAERQALVFTDSHAFVRTVHAIEQYLSIAMYTTVKRGEFVAQLPTLTQQLADAHDGVARLSRDDEGVLFAMRGSIVPLPSMLSVANWTRMTQSVLPVLSRARDLAKQAVVRQQLKQLATACGAYTIDHAGTYPPTLEALLDAGILTSPGTLISPRLGPDDRPHFIYVTGQSTDSHPNNVLIYERVIVPGDPVLVAYADASVDRVDYDTFVAQLQATYERLGRPADLPAEFRNGR